MKRRTLIKTGLFALLTPFIKPLVAVASIVQGRWSKWAISAYAGGGRIRCRNRKIDDNRFEIEIESFFDPNGKPWSFKANTVPMKKWKLPQ